METAMRDILARQEAVAEGGAATIPLAPCSSYAVWSLQGASGKTAIAFNLAYAADSVLAVDTCPQCRLSSLCDRELFRHAPLTVNELLLPHFRSGLGSASRVAQSIAATNPAFAGRRSFFISSSLELAVFPLLMAQALERQRGKAKAWDEMLFSLSCELAREMQETQTSRCLIDTSSFFAGATLLALHAADALVVPVRADKPSVMALERLFALLGDPAGPFRSTLPSSGHAPKIQMVVLTHCEWSTSRGARHRASQQTRECLRQVLDVIRRHVQCFTTDDPSSHLICLDDFAGSGRVAMGKAKPLALVKPGESLCIDRMRTAVSPSLGKVQNQLAFLGRCLWGADAFGTALQAEGAVPVAGDSPSSSAAGRRVQITAKER